MTKALGSAPITQLEQYSLSCSGACSEGITKSPRSNRHDFQVDHILNYNATKIFGDWTCLEKEFFIEAVKKAKSTNFKKSCPNTLSGPRGHRSFLNKKTQNTY